MIQRWEQESCIASINNINIWEVEQFPERQTFRLMILEREAAVSLYTFSSNVILRQKVSVPANTSLYCSEVRTGRQSALYPPVMLHSPTCSRPSLPNFSHGIKRNL